jgi:hypothetical protein
LLGKLLFSLGEDSAWHRDFSRELVRFIVHDRPENAALVESWLRQWQEPVQVAMSTLAPLFGDPDFSSLAAFEEKRARLWSAAEIVGRSQS